MNKKIICKILPVITLMVIVMPITRANTITLRLKSDCYRDQDCETSIENSRCHLGYCRCQPFFAEFNETRCVESTLLGNDCLVPEQCSMKVANSSCLAGVCRCEEGYLQFRRHTCLKPAKLGQVCYSHEHCRLWDNDTHCDFLIPDLFGRCQCTAPMKNDGDVCRRDNLVMLSTYTTDPTIDSNINSSDTGVQIAWLKNTTNKQQLASVTTQKIPMNLITIRSMYRTPKPHHRRHHEDTNELPDDNDTIVVDANVITEFIQNASSTPTPTKADRHETTSVVPVSLGYSCYNDLECQMADKHSRCVDGSCDCVMYGNRNSSCGARKPGCPVGSFQCRDSGVCISWFFVCDGRPDCADSSDEQCKIDNCPKQSFKCTKSGVCISRSGQCDGRVDCPNGEDEEGCKNRRACPEGSFRCNNGQCLPAYEFCNAVVSCRDGSDEPRGTCRIRNRDRITTKYCPFRCANGRCRSDAITCSGRDGCGDGSDEINCSVCKCPPVL